MKLKEMYDVRVKISNESELGVLLTLYRKGGFRWINEMLGWEGGSYTQYVKERGYPVYVSTEKNFGSHFGSTSSKAITLNEFRKEQGIMKYSAGDVYKFDVTGAELKILGVVDEVVAVSSFNDHDKFEAWYTVAHMDRSYTLKTETTKTDMSVSEIEKALGKAAGSLNVVAE